MHFNNSKSYERTLKVVLVIAIIVTGLWVTGHLDGAPRKIITPAMKQANRLYSVLDLVRRVYVEEPDLEILTEGAIEGMLKRLDPHSNYLSAKQQERFRERDVGEFEGIGISFVIQNELITVISPIMGTPAERLGIRSGDKIIEIDGVSAYGISQEEVPKKLRGPKGTTVDVKVMREDVPEPLEFTIVRDKIPIHSVWTHFMLDDSTGYIMLNQFMATTDDELETALDDLESQGMTRLIFDLRNNGGGRWNQAVSVADFFIPGGYQIVSKRGRNERETEIKYSSDRTTREMFDLVILINGGSASASEIVSGAVQDLDRGLIVGEKSFGKGLVQSQFPGPDGAMIRLTTARWYTPKGRCVQRPYDKGRGEYYAVRYRSVDEDGEDEEDVEPADDEVDNNEETEVYYSKGGRELLPYSAITPDIEVEDGKISGATARIRSNRLLFAYAEKIKIEKDLDNSLDFMDFMQNYKLDEETLRGLIDFAKSEKDITYPEEAFEEDKDYLHRQIKADLAQLIWNDRNYYYMVFTAGDRTVKEAMNSFAKAKEIASVWQ